MNELEILCNKINEVAKNYEGEKEVISDILAEDVFSRIKLMRLILPGDYLLFLASINLLNSYVKQDDAKLGYSFKREIDYLLTKCMTNKYDFIKYNKEDNLYIVEIYNLQFSFHYLKLDDKIAEGYTETITWDGIRKQKCALTIYNMIKESGIELSKVDLIDE